jgi:hypothetical protein
MRLQHYPDSPYKKQVVVWAQNNGLTSSESIHIPDTIVSVVENYIRNNPETFKLGEGDDEFNGIEVEPWGSNSESLRGRVFKNEYDFPRSVPPTFKMEPFVKRNLLAMILTRNRDYPLYVAKLDCKVGGWDLLFDIENRVILFLYTLTPPPTVPTISLIGPFTTLSEDEVRNLYFNEEWSKFMLTPTLIAFKGVCNTLNDKFAALPPAIVAPPPPAAALQQRLRAPGWRVTRPKVAARAARWKIAPKPLPKPPSSAAPPQVPLLPPSQVPLLPPPPAALPQAQAPPPQPLVTTSFAPPPLPLPPPPPPPPDGTSVEVYLIRLMYNIKGNLELIRDTICRDVTLSQNFSDTFWNYLLNSLDGILDGSETPKEVNHIVNILFCSTGDTNPNNRDNVQINKNIKHIKNLCSNHNLLLKVSISLKRFVGTQNFERTILYYLKFIQNLLYNRNANTNAGNRAGKLLTILKDLLIFLRDNLQRGLKTFAASVTYESINIINTVFKIVQNLGRLGRDFKLNMIDVDIGTFILQFFEKIADSSPVDKDILQSAVYAFINIAYTDDKQDKTYITALLKTALLKTANMVIIFTGLSLSIINALKDLQAFAQQQKDYVIKSPGLPDIPVYLVIQRIIGDIQSFIRNNGQTITPTPERTGVGFSSVASVRTPPSPGITALSSSYTGISAPSSSPVYIGANPWVNRSPETQIGLAPRNTYKRGNAGKPAWQPAGLTRRLGRNLPRLSTPLSTSPPQSPKVVREGSWYNRLSANRSTSQNKSLSQRSPQLPGRVPTGSSPFPSSQVPGTPLRPIREPLNGRPSTIPPPPSVPPPLSSFNPMARVLSRTLGGSRREGKRRTIRRKRRNIRHYKNGRSRRNS